MKLEIVRFQATDIDMQGNWFTDNIDGQAFEGVASVLRRLSLAWCAITRLDEALFRGMFSLEALHLEENAITDIPSRLLQVRFLQDFNTIATKSRKKKRQVDKEAIGSPRVKATIIRLFIYL